MNLRRLRRSLNKVLLAQASGRVGHSLIQYRFAA
jgi:hypothetical protein